MLQRNNISLPSWYACVDKRAVSGAVLPPPEPGTLRCGPLTILRPESNCEFITFGPNWASAVLFEGYLFDTTDLASQLDSSSPKRSEADLVASAYRRWGVDFFEHLEGGYLTAVWDAAERRLIVGHDGLGKHPLYYASTSTHFYFTSNIFALAYNGAVPRRPNRLAFAWRLQLSWPPSGETFFQDIHRVRPGHYLDLDNKGIVQEKAYWHFAPESDDPWLPDDVVLEQFETRITDAVRRCMELQPEGILLSGGIDSVAIAVLASDYTKAHGLPSLTACSGRAQRELPPTQEDEIQNRVAQRLGMHHLVWHRTDRGNGRQTLYDILNQVPDQVAPTDVWWTSPYGAFRSAIASKGLSILLTGSGGDEWLGLHPAYAADLIRQVRLTKLVQFLAAEKYAGGRRFRFLCRYHLWQNGLRRILGSLWERVAPDAKKSYSRARAEKSLTSWLCPDPEVRAQLLESFDERRVPELDGHGRIPRSYYLHTLRSAWKEAPMPHEFESNYHTLSRVGLRFLTPYHDRQLADFLMQTPPDLFIRRNRYKGLTRHLVSARLPGLGFGNQMKTSDSTGENSPLPTLRDHVQDALEHFGSSRLEELGLVNSRELKVLAHESPRLAVDMLVRIFNVVSAEIWISAHMQDCSAQK